MSDKVKLPMQLIDTPDGALTVMRPVAEQLLREGVISGELDGLLRAADAATVKAAMMAGAGYCDFCAAPGATHSFMVPDFDMPGGFARSTGGWAACDACNELVLAGRREALLDRAVAGASYPKFSRKAIGEMHARFWEGFGQLHALAEEAKTIRDFVEDRLPSGLRPTATSRDLRIDSIVRLSGLTREEVEGIAREEISTATLAKIQRWRQTFAESNPPRVRQVLDLIAAPHKPLPDVVPHWQTALDKRFAALSHLRTALAGATSRTFVSPEWTDLNDPTALRALMDRTALTKTLVDLGFGQDVKFLAAAQAYSFSGETVAAIREAAETLPHEAPLSSVEAPNTGAGWFWFAEPLVFGTNHVDALLWGWSDVRTGDYKLRLTDRDLARATPAQLKVLAGVTAGPDGFVGREQLAQIEEVLLAIGVTSTSGHIVPATSPAILFSAFVLNDEAKAGLPVGAPLPSIRWTWPLALSLHEMLAFNRAAWDRDVAAMQEVFEAPLDKEATLAVVAELSVFFLMACLWFKQTVPAGGKGKARPPVLEQSAGHVERHARKRYAREHQLAAPPTVQVVALRKTARVEAEPSDQAGPHGTREYHVRWIVRGHPRLQACGPGRKDRKLIWIEAHPAGPEDKPLKVRERVYAVVR